MKNLKLFFEDVIEKEAFATADINVFLLFPSVKNSAYTKAR